MKPLTLRLENFRSFRNPREFDFRNMRLFAIIGDTGVGKTSILEAIAYALFGQANAYEGRASSELLAKGTRSGSVTFGFSVEGEEYTVRRLLRTNAQVQLRCESRNLEVTGAHAVNEKIKEILCMDFKSFMHTVLLPQGMHTRLLKSTAADRTRVLSQLFRLEGLEEIGRLAGGEANRASAFLEALNVELGGIGEDPQQRVTDAERAVSESVAAYATAVKAAEKVDAIDLKLSQAREAKTALESEATSLKQIDGVAEELARIDVVEAELAPRVEQLKKAHDQRTQAKADAQQKATELQRAGLDVTSLRPIERDLNLIMNAVTTMNSEATNQERFRTEASELASVVKDRNAALEATRTAQSEIAGVVTKAGEERTEAIGKLDALNAARNSTADAERELGASADEVARIGATHSAAEQQLRAVQSKHEAISTQLRKAEGAFATAELEDRVAAIAGHLHAGDDCPVCHRALPNEFAPPQNDALDTARQDLKTARDRAAESQRSLESARLAHNTSGTELRTANERSKGWQTETEARRAKLDALLVSGETPDAAVKRLTQIKDAADERLRDLNRDKSQVDARVVVDSNALTEAQTKAAAVERQLRDSKARYDTANRSFTTLSDGLPKAYRPKADLAAVGKMRETVERLRAEATAVDGSNLEASNALAQVTEERRLVEVDFGRQVREPRGRAFEHLNAIAGRLDAGDMPDTKAQQKKWIDRVIKGARSRLDAISKELSTVQGGIDKKQTERQAVIESVGGEPGRVAQDLAIRKNNAEHALETARAAAAHASDILSRRSRIIDISAGLSGVRTAMLPASFPTFATNQRQRRLIEEATVVLRAISNDQYSFTKSFDVFDAETNAERSTHSLSGGEAFLASVALSLAAVKVASNAGNKIESLFLDEGFDSLDAGRLECVMLALRKRAQAGQTICVISHVSQVTEYVDSTLQVFKSSTGSDYRLRGALDEDEATMEGLVSHLTPAAP